MLHFRYHGASAGFQYGSNSSESAYEESGQMVAQRARGTQRRPRDAPDTARRIGRTHRGAAVGGRRLATDTRAARHVAAPGLRAIGPLELRLTDTVPYTATASQCRRSPDRARSARA